jgi:hypothetical protein
LREELTKVPADSDRASVIIAKMTELQKQGFALDDDLQKRSKGIDIPAVQKAVRDLITLPDAVRRKADLSSTFSHAFDYQAGSGSGPARKRVADMEAKGRKHIESLIPASILDDVGAATVAWGYKGRAYASVGSREFQIFSNSPLTHFLHEFVHLVEYNSLRRFAAPGLSPATVRRSHKFYDERTTRPDGTRDPLKKLGPGYEPDEVWREDKWIEKGWNKYAGKQYQGDVWEFNTVGAERFLNDPANFFIDDPEGFFHVLDLLQRRAP